jgi:hypothetical protein
MVAPKESPDSGYNRFPYSTTTPAQRPPDLLQNLRKHTVHNSTKTGRFALKFKNQIDLRVFCKNAHFYSHI